MFVIIYIMATYIFYENPLLGYLVDLLNVPFFFFIVFPIFFLVDYFRIDLLLNHWLIANNLPLSMIGFPLFTIIYPAAELFYYYILTCIIVCIARRLTLQKTIL